MSLLCDLTTGMLCMPCWPTCLRSQHNRRRSWALPDALVLQNHLLPSIKTTAPDLVACIRQVLQNQLLPSIRQPLQNQLFPSIRQLLQNQWLPSIRHLLRREQSIPVVQNHLLPSIRQLLQENGTLPVVQNWGRVASSDFCVYGTKLTKGVLHITTIAGMNARYNRYLQAEQQTENRGAFLFRLC